MYKAINNQLLSNIQKLFLGREEGYNLSGKFHLKQCCARTMIQSMCVSICGALLWGEPEEEIKQSKHSKQFKEMYKNIGRGNVNCDIDVIGFLLIIFGECFDYRYICEGHEQSGQIVRRDTGVESWFMRLTLY